MVFYDCGWRMGLGPQETPLRFWWWMKQLFQDRGSAAVVQGSSLTYVTPLCLSHPISCLLSAVPSNKATKKTPKQQTTNVRREGIFRHFCFYLREYCMDLNVTNLVYFGGWYL